MPLPNDLITLSPGTLRKKKKSYTPNHLELHTWKIFSPHCLDDCSIGYKRKKKKRQPLNSKRNYFEIVPDDVFGEENLH